MSEDEVTSIDDFDVVQGVSRDDYVMVTNPDSGFASLDDLKAATKKVTYGTTGVGTGSPALLRSADRQRRRRQARPCRSTAALRR